MGFTIEEIELALTVELENQPVYLSQQMDLKQSANYPIIIDYLSGRIHPLPTLQRDAQINHWYNLFNLLRDIENISPDTQLVLDVIYEPTIYSYIRYHLNNWLLIYVFANETESALQAVLKQFKNQGISDTDIFLSFIFRYRHEDNDITIIEKTPLIVFLLNHIKKSNQIVFNSPTNHTYQNGWSNLYFKLIEEAKPNLVVDYALYGIQLNGYNLIPFFEKHKNGKYLPEIISYITEQKDQNLPTIQTKFIVALQLYEIDANKYNGVAIQLAKLHLAYISFHAPRLHWEQNFELKELAGTELNRLPYSAIAFHFLFKNDKSNAIVFLNKWLNDKIPLQPQTLKLIYYHLGQEALSIFKLALYNTEGGIDYLSAAINLLAQHFKPEDYIEDIWKLIGIKSKNVKSIVINTLAEKDPEAEAKSILLLENKKTETRQTAAIILSRFNTPNSQAAIIKTINQETNDNTRDILLATVAHTLPAETTEVFVQEMIEAATKRGKLAKPIEAWLDESELPHLFYQNKLPLEANAIRFLLYRMSRVKTMQSDIEAKYLIQLLDKETAAPFAKALIKIFIDKGAKPDHKYLLAIAALLGNDEIVDFIARTINKWIDENRYKMAEYGVGALAIQGSNKALRKVEWYSRKYKAKKANVGAAALLALETAAEELGITTHELGDRVVPDFGFEGLFKTFEIAGEEFRAFIDSNFKIAYFNDDNKKLKALPANASKDLKEEFKDIGKEVRDIVKSQSSRLEYYLIIQRRWTVGQWKNFFLQNPVMFIYATKLLWGVYDGEGQLTSTFLCTEDTSLINVESDEIELPEGEYFIGMLHPTQLSAAELQVWKKQIFDQSIQPIFSQLDRPTADLTDIDMNKAIITKYNDRQTENESIRSTLERRGWHKGPTGDGGMIESYNLLYFEKRLEAILEIEGVGAGYGWGGDEKLGKLYVINKSKVTAKWFSSPQKDDDEMLVKLKDVPVIFLNEMLAAVEAIKLKVKTS